MRNKELEWKGIIAYRAGIMRIARFLFYGKFSALPS